jgi:hypothetical protein
MDIFAIQKDKTIPQRRGIYSWNFTLFLARQYMYIRVCASKVYYIAIFAVCSPSVPSHMGSTTVTRIPVTLCHKDLQVTQT